MQSAFSSNEFVFVPTYMRIGWGRIYNCQLIDTASFVLLCAQTIIINYFIFQYY